MQLCFWLIFQKCISLDSEFECMLKGSSLATPKSWNVRQLIILFISGLQDMSGETVYEADRQGGSATSSGCSRGAWFTRLRVRVAGFFWVFWSACYSVVTIGNDKATTCLWSGQSGRGPSRARVPVFHTRVPHPWIFKLKSETSMRL